MAKNPFAPSRDDGRSDRVVIIDLVEDGEPGDFYSYDIILDALEEGLDDRPERDRAHRAVAQANKYLLRDRKRYLSVIRGKGYKMLRADEHLPVALGKKDRAETYLRKGIELLRNARIDELSEAQRTLHEGQLMILGGVYTAVRESARRHDLQERVIDQIRRQQEEARRHQSEMDERLRRIEGS